MTNTEKIQASGSRPSRRTIVKGAAWAVPAITVAAAVPMAAASVTCTGTLCLTGDFCKLPGEGNNQDCKGGDCGKGYRANATLQPDSRDRIIFVKQTVGPGNSSTDSAPRICGGSAVKPTTCTCTIAAPAGYATVYVSGTTAVTQFTVDACRFDNSQNTTITLDYQIYACSASGPCTLIETASTSGGAHPCK